MGILKTAATVAVASSVHGRVQRRQQARWAAQDQQAAAGQAPQPPPQQPSSSPPQQPLPQQSQAPAAPAQSDDMADQLANLAKLGELMNAGLLTQAEFDQQKARILSG